MDREALEHSLVRRLLDHIENHTTDMADEVYEVPAEAYTSRAHFEQELEVLFNGSPLVLCLSGSLPAAGHLPDRGPLRHARARDQRRRGKGAGHGEHVPSPRGSGRRRQR